MAKEKIRGNNAPRLTEGKRVKLQEMIDLYRGGPDGLRGSFINCYRKVYPNCKSDQAARKGSYDAFHHPYVQEQLAKKAKEIAMKADITQEKVLREIARIAFLDVRNLFNDDGSPKALSELDDDSAAAIAGIKKMKMSDDWETVEYKFSSKDAALEKLMRHLGLYQQDNEQKNTSLAEALTAGIERVKELRE